MLDKDEDQGRECYSFASTVVIPEGSKGLTRETRDSILLSACTLKEVLFDKIGD